MRSPITLALLLSAPLCQAFMAASPTTLGAAGARTSHAAVMIAERRKVAPKKSVGRGSAATKSPSKKGSLPARTKAISFDFLSGFGGEHKAATTTKAEKVEGLKLPEVPSFKMPSFGGSAQESAPPPKPKFPVSMPSMSMPSVAIPSGMPLPSFSLPSLASPAAAPTSTPTEADDAPVESESAVEPRASDDLASTVTKGLKTLGNLMLNTLTTLLQLLLAKAQLAALRQFRATQAAVDARIAQAEAAPTLLLAKLRRAAYVAPFYARAALELFAEDAQRKLALARAEAARCVDDAPRYYGEQLEAATAAALAKPEQIVNEVAETVRAKLESAQATVDGAVAQAKAQAESLRK